MARQVVHLDLDTSEPGQITVRQEGHLHAAQDRMRQDVSAMSHTLVVFHAHPDDEALLTSGTMAKAAAAGHRVVLVVATDGDLGLAASSYRSGGATLGAVRIARVAAQSATALGVARTVHLGYADSGSGPLLYDDPPGLVTRFARADDRRGRRTDSPTILR